VDQRQKVREWNESVRDTKMKCVKRKIRRKRKLRKLKDKKGLTNIGLKGWLRKKVDIMTMFLFKDDIDDIPDCDKYYYDEFKKLYGYDGGSYNLKIILMLLKQYYECAIIREKCHVG
jgi:hypothetical protein